MAGYVYGGNQKYADAPSGRGGRVCGAKRGTVAGWHRHKRQLEQPCDPCREAYNAYHRQRRADDKSRIPHRLYSRAKNRAQRELARRHATEFEALFRVELARVNTEPDLPATPKESHR